MFFNFSATFLVGSFASFLWLSPFLVGSCAAFLWTSPWQVPYFVKQYVTPYDYGLGLLQNDQDCFLNCVAFRCCFGPPLQLADVDACDGVAAETQHLVGARDVSATFQVMIAPEAPPYAPENVTFVDWNMHLVVTCNTSDCTLPLLWRGTHTIFSKVLLAANTTPPVDWTDEGPGARNVSFQFVGTPPSYNEEVLLTFMLANRSDAAGVAGVDCVRLRTRYVVDDGATRYPTAAPTSSTSLPTVAPSTQPSAAPSPSPTPSSSSPLSSSSTSSSSTTAASTGLSTTTAIGDRRDDASTSAARADATLLIVLGVVACVLLLAVIAAATAYYSLNRRVSSRRQKRSRTLYGASPPSSESDATSTSTNAVSARSVRNSRRASTQLSRRPSHRRLSVNPLLAGADVDNYAALPTRAALAMAANGGAAAAAPPVHVYEQFSSFGAQSSGATSRRRGAASSSSSDGPTYEYSNVSGGSIASTLKSSSASSSSATAAAAGGYDQMRRVRRGNVSRTYDVLALSSNASSADYMNHVNAATGSGDYTRPAPAYENRPVQ